MKKDQEIIVYGTIAPGADVGGNGGNGGNGAVGGPPCPVCHGVFYDYDNGYIVCSNCNKKQP